ncbi:hypothetical protein CTZ27_25560 [Streptomyces griseocarneus]|nr:hypothetical protein CTZ27_25560 [Streptomyces griseocarneus]
MAVLLAAVPFAWHQAGHLLADEPAVVRVLSTTVFHTDNEGDTYVFPDALDLTLAERRSAYAAEPARSGSWETADRWFRSRGGVDPDASDVQVVLQGVRQTPVRITDLEVNADCIAPLTGTLMLAPAAGEDDSIRIGVDLDSARRVPYIRDGSGKKTPYFPEHTISLAEKEQVVLDILATTTRHYCAYTYRLKILTEDGERSLTIDEHGQPFKVSAAPFTKVGEFWKPPTFRRLYIGGDLNHTGAVDPWAPKDPKTYLAP